MQQRVFLLGLIPLRKGSAEAAQMNRVSANLNNPTRGLKSRKGSVMRKLALVNSIILMACLWTPRCFAQSPSGGIPIRITDGPTPKCINGSTDQVWLTLYRVVMTKKTGWFAASNQAELVITVQVKTKPQSNQTLSYPLSSKVNTRDYPTGQVSIPVEYTIVSGLNLKQDNVFYTGLSVDTTVINFSSQSNLGATLSALAELTGNKKLPIPDSPYAQVAGYLLEFANTTITNEISNRNADDKYTTASLALNFDPDGSCADASGDGQGFETTGTKAIVMGEGSPGDSYVPIDQVGNYCWTAETKPAFVLKAARKVPGRLLCTDPIYATLYKPITNNYLAYFLQKRSIAGGKADVVEGDVADSKRLCSALNVTDCPSVNR
jgi:hypothetical protein